MINCMWNWFLNPKLKHKCMNIHVLGEEEVFLLHKLLYRDGNIHYFHKIMSILKKDEYV